jgi:dihydrofolate reductase
MAQKTSLFIATSLDGFIAGSDGNIQFLQDFHNSLEDYGYNTFMEDVETVLMGRYTYDQRCSMGHKTHSDKELYVITRSMQKPELGKTFFSGRVENLVTELRQSTEGKVFIDGGARLINSLLSFRLIDEIYLNILPILLGEGIRLFRENRPKQHFMLMKSEAFENGLIQLHYQLKE